jgi:hypothetical protein
LQRPHKKLLERGLLCLPASRKVLPLLPTFQIFLLNLLLADAALLISTQP